MLHWKGPRSTDAPRSLKAGGGVSRARPQTRSLHSPSANAELSPGERASAARLSTPNDTSRSRRGSLPHALHLRQAWGGCRERDCAARMPCSLGFERTHIGSALPVSRIKVSVSGIRCARVSWFEYRSPMPSQRLGVAAYVHRGWIDVLCRQQSFWGRGPNRATVEGWFLAPHMGASRGADGVLPPR